MKALIESNHIKPVMDRHFPLEQTREAHRYIESGRKSGNVVIILKKVSRKQRVLVYPVVNSVTFSEATSIRIQGAFAKH